MLTLQRSSHVPIGMISFRRGDYIIEELRELLDREGVETALIISGIGALDICNLHTVTNPTLPPVPRYCALEGHIQVGSLQGTIAGGEPHLHVIVSHNTDNDRIYVGHLEPGSRCCYTVEMGLMILEGLRTKRVRDPKTGLVQVVVSDCSQSL